MHRNIRSLHSNFLFNSALCLILTLASSANALVLRMPAADILTTNPTPTVVIPDFNREDALNDPQNRISNDFKVPKNLFPRTAFWFDIYTKYGSQDHVI